MVVKILIWNTVKDKNKDYWNKKASTWPVSLGPYKNQASALQKTSTASKMDCSGKIFSLFQSNSLPIHRSQVKKSHWPSRGKLWNSQRSKKTTLTHSLLIALSHRCESKHAVLVHFGPQYTPEGIPETHTHCIHPPYTISNSFRLWGRDCLTRCQAEFTHNWLGVGDWQGICSDWSVLLRAAHIC